MSNATWMSNSSVQSLEIGKIVLPGTHDSGSYSIQRGVLSQINYGNINFLWQINSGSAPANGSAPWSNPLPGMPNLLNPINEKNSEDGFSNLNYLYLGQSMYNMVMDVAYDMSRSQDNTILQQLNDGIRYFDLRVYWDTNLNGFYIQHGLCGCSFSQVLSDVSAFINANTTASELIVLVVSHLNIASGSVEATSLANLISANLPKGALYEPPSVSAGTDPFLSLATSTIGSLTGGSNKVLVLNGDYPSISYDSVLFNSVGYTAFPNGDYGTDSLTALSSAAEQAMGQMTSGNLGRLSWCLTCQTQDAITDVVNQLSGASGTLPALQGLAVTANNGLPNFLNGLDSAQTNTINCITVDWYEQTTGQNVVQLAINMNTARAGA
ncbi:hypothetical protein [Azospirillum griseum]|uniref:Phosphatidylinositol diacylglycerol-lyase n=1 Tax=Azospirillum griseum TaxID=2496639 RepID=A0A3S0HW72_9PROT|nr:hypothetical protein [Azospirillum griseum]RTR18350.1 hypothetical protein EJ903_15970 [Azospirillum griseum]